MEPRSQYVLSKLSSLLYQNSDAEAGLRQYWMPDDISLECYECTSKFTSFRRRHHCRVCGQVFCSKCCSSYIPGKHIGHSGNLRVCTFCFRSFQSMLEQGGLANDTHVEAEGRVLGDAVQYRRRPSIDQVAQLSGSQPHLASSPASLKVNRKTSMNVPLYGGDNISDSDSSPLTQGIHEMVKLKDPLALSRLWERVIDPTVGIQLETHRYYLRSYPGTFQGCRLVGWLMAQDQPGTSRAQAVAIGQALLSAGLMTSISGQDIFCDNTDLYQPCQTNLAEVRESPPARTPEPNVQEPAWLQELADSPFKPDKKSSNSSQSNNENRHRDYRDSETVPDGMLEVGVRELKNSVAAYEESEENELLDSTYKFHEDRYLNTLLTSEGIPSEWRETILNLAEKAVDLVKPDVKFNGDEMDIRNYVKVKCVAWGNQEDSRLVEGEVCSLKLTHKGMAENIHKPRIALVAESIMFKDRQTLVSMESIQLQEAEYVKNLIGKLLDSRPNVVLVEKTVTNLAQDIFLKEGVSLAVNVKPKLLERIARRTQGAIINSVDSMMAPPKLGTCEEFISQLSSSEPGRRGTRLMVFDGCVPSLGVTILLRGGDRLFLSKVKAVLKRILMIKYNWKHEKSLLTNEYASLMDNDVIQGEFDKYQLAISPFIKVPTDNSVPYAIEAKDVSDITVEETPDEDIDCHPQYQMHPWCKDFIEMKITDLSDEEIENKKALFRAAGWRKDPPPPLVTKPKVNYTVVLPEDHTETLSVQFAMYSKQSNVAPNYCVAPWIVNMQMYGSLDIGLGDFLENLCFSSDYSCPNKQCTTPPLHHTRRFCHAGGAVTLHMQQLEAPIMGDDKDRLMMWKYCTSCELITNIVPVSEATWSLSFAMFLHILLHENQLVRRGANRPDATCHHSLHQEHLTCFGKGDQVTTFRYAKLHVWGLSTPSERLLVPPPNYSKEYMMKYLMEYKKAGSSLYSAVLEKLHQVKVDNAEFATVLLAEQEQEHKVYRERVESLEEKVNGSECHSIETLLLLRIFQHNILETHHSWLKKLSTEVANKNNKKGLTRTSSIDALDSIGKKTDSDTTVKKIISTILPHTEECVLPNPFPQDTHLITHINGIELECSNPYFVTENKPSSLISYLLSSPSYQEYLSSESGDQHFVLEMSDMTTKFYCCSYFTKEFDQLRKLIFPNGEKNFVYSLADCSRWEAMGGKSGLLFYKTKDDRFVLKQMSRFEYQSFLDFAPHYFQYLQQSIQNGNKTLLGKIVGVFKIGFKNSLTGSGMTMEFLIMENLFYDKEVTKSYDLKGSVRNRLITEGESQSGQVLLDENLVRVSCESPLYIDQQDKEILNEAVKRDTAFLASHHMMDYSLLAGICNKDNTLVVGIIDYIRTFTWDKKLETLVKSVKSSGVFGGQAKTPTVINPDLYQMRFTDAMNRYFSTVPQ